MNPCHDRWLAALTSVATLVAIVGTMLLIFPVDAVAQTLTLDVGEPGGSTTARILQMVALIALLSLAPGLLVTVTSFTRIVVVLSLLRTALGTQQSPPNVVIISLALFLTGFIMTPTFEQAWEDGLADFTEAVAALPEPFQIRFRWFMRDPAWGASSGRYELFCCQEAAKIAAYLDHDGFIDDHMTAFYSSEEDQDAAGVADGHSGNTFGMACRLATIYLTNPEILWMAHGALCGMVGCETAGCYAGASGTEALSEMGE